MLTVVEMTDCPMLDNCSSVPLDTGNDGRPWVSDPKPTTTLDGRLD